MKPRRKKRTKPIPIPLESVSVPSSDPAVVIPTAGSVIQPVKSSVVGQHIFPESKLSPMVLEWKRLVKEERDDDALRLLEQIIVSSSEMYARLAQHENFHRTVSVNQLIAAAQQKTAVWLVHWDPARGSLFSWLSKCAKNVFRAELARVLSHQKRICSTDDDVTLDRLMGSVDHEVDLHDAAAEIEAKLKDITGRWAGHQERGCIQYLIACISSDTHNKLNSIKAASYAWGISFEMSRFFYSWCVITLRQALLEKAFNPITEQDLIRCSYTNTLIPDFIDTIGFILFKKVIGIFGGMRIRIPSIADIDKQRKKLILYREMDASSMDPDTVATLAKKSGRTARSAMEVFLEMTDTFNPKNGGEHYVYDQFGAH